VPKKAKRTSKVDYAALTASLGAALLPDVLDSLIRLTAAHHVNGHKAVMHRHERQGLPAECFTAAWITHVSSFFWSKRATSGFRVLRIFAVREAERGRLGANA